MYTYFFQRQMVYEFQGVCEQRLVYKDTVTTGGAANGETRYRASELGSCSEALQHQL